MFPHGRAQNYICLQKGPCYPEIKIIQEERELRLAAKREKDKKIKKGVCMSPPNFWYALSLTTWLQTSNIYRLNRTCSVCCVCNNQAKLPDQHLLFKAIEFSQEGIYYSPVTGQRKATINVVRVAGMMISQVNWGFFGFFFLVWYKQY